MKIDHSLLSEIAAWLGEAALNETASVGATSSASIGTVVNPHISPGRARGRRSYIGSPGRSGTLAPSQPKVIQPKTKMGTAKNALDMPSNVFGTGAVITRSRSRTRGRGRPR